jgi:argininosuccinate lyase
MLAKQGSSPKRRGRKILQALAEIRKLDKGFDGSAKTSTLWSKALVEGCGTSKSYTGPERPGCSGCAALREGAISRVDGLIREMQRALVFLAEKNSEVIMPGYTHLQRAQPVLLSHHLLAYYEMLKRDRQRFGESLKRVNVLPLGSAALAGSTFDLDREMVARELGFDAISENSMDAVSDRDFVLEFIFASSVLMMHLSRLSEELVIWSTKEFDFVFLPDAFCRGSIMPQKKNPDLMELVRAKTGRVYGHLTALLTTMKGLPLTYNKDMQEDKEPLFDAVDTVEQSLVVMTRLLREISFNKERMRKAVDEGYLVATDLADYLVLKGRDLPGPRNRGQDGPLCLDHRKKAADPEGDEGFFRTN